jgi:DNA-binding protein HU-beta
MNKKDLVNIVYSKISVPKKDCELVIDTLFSTMEEVLTNGEDILISNFGSFEIKETKEKKMVSLHSKEEIVVPSKKNLKFHPSKKIKDNIK